MTGDIAFVTGAAGGIGKAACALFHRLGYRLWATDMDRAGLAELERLYPDARTDRVDLRQREELKTLCRAIEAEGERIALGFVNAGVVKPGPAAETDEEVIDFHIDVNLRAAALLNRSLTIKMSAQGAGHIVSTISTAGMSALPGSAAYTASKFGLRGFVLSLAEEARPLGVKYTCLYPNAVDTPMLREEGLSGGSPLNFLSEPLTTDRVAKALEKAVQRQPLEIFVPASDWFLAKFATGFPQAMKWLLPVLTRIGERGRRKFYEKRGLV